jgi:hypothetical protein
MTETYAPLVEDALAVPMAELYPDAGKELAGCEARVQVHPGVSQVSLLCAQGLIVDIRSIELPEHALTVAHAIGQGEAAGQRVESILGTLDGRQLSIVKTTSPPPSSPDTASVNHIVSNPDAQGMAQLLTCGYSGAEDPELREAWCREVQLALLAPVGEPIEERYMEFTIPAPPDE